MTRARLVLADGACFEGTLLGEGATGEVVFNTAMLGYEEALTDPSYAGQILVFTSPHVGNTGVTERDSESERIQPRGVILNATPTAPSNYAAKQSLPEWLAKSGVPALCNVDTRRLVLHLRKHGTQMGVIGTDPVAELHESVRALALPHSKELLQQVATRTPYTLNAQGRFKVVAYDFGSKQSMFSLLTNAGAALTVVPPDYPAAEALALQPDGIFLSNGPGDPAELDAQVDTVRALLGKAPLFGICLGHQLLARALGAATYRLPFGHRGVNQAVRDEATGKVLVTVQNHGYAVAPELPDGLQVTHTNLNDGTVEGLRAPALNAWSVQFHPEAAPGPHDARGLFSAFANACMETRS